MCEKFGDINFKFVLTVRSSNPPAANIFRQQGCPRGTIVTTLSGQNASGYVTLEN